MGKGDRKTKKGKIWMGSFGNTRPRPNASSDNSTPATTAKPKAAKKAEPAKKASTAKKSTTAKKTTAKKKTEKADK